MLKRVQEKTRRRQGGRFAIIASKFNRKHVDSMLKAAQAVLIRAGAEDIQVFRVPGAFEIPAVAACLTEAKRPAFSAVLCLGVIMRGETTHAQHIGESVSLALAQLQLTRKVPVIHGVYLFENKEQARKRCLDPQHNRGIELAQSALEMARLFRKLQSSNKASFRPNQSRHGR
jgi:6,7-dimethyl-8-ribityllumazine synthase